MQLFRGFKRELCTADWRICVSVGLTSGLLCGIILWLAGGNAVYQQICGDSVVQIPSYWLFLKQVVALILGLALGLLVGRQCTCSFRCRKKAIAWWISGYSAMLLWILIFFSGRGEVLSLLLLVWSIISFLIAIEWFARECLLSALLLLIGILWMMGSFGLTIRIILWN